MFLLWLCCLQEAHEPIRPTDPLLSAEQLLARGVDPAAAKLYGCAGCLHCCPITPCALLGPILAQMLSV